MIDLVLLASGCVTFIVATLVCNTFKNPWNIVFVIWFPLLYLSSLSLTGLTPPSVVTKLLFFFSLLSMFFGFISCGNKHSSFFIVDINSKVVFNISLVGLVIIFVPLVVTLKIIYQSGYLEFLALTRWSGGDRSNAFGSKFIYSIVNYFFIPIAYACFFLAISKFLLSKEKDYLIKLNLFLACLMLLTHAFLLTSRIELLVVVSAMLMGAFLTSNLTKKIILPLVLIATLAVLLSINRIGQEGILMNIFKVFVIDYHTVSFSMFDNSYLNKESFFYSYDTFGLTTFSIINFPIERISSFIYSFRDVGVDTLVIKEMSQSVSVGFSDGVELKYNSFYSGLAPLFIDFSYFMFIPLFLFGFIIRYLYNSFKVMRSEYFLALLLFCLYTIYVSLFFPPFIKQSYWISFLIIFTLPLISKVKVK
ncbi:hypothetical protein A9261_18870 [Vibrio tasmaniensis]|nr:hypothetical protein A9261_18870 [Vibrio tasmaniensis]